MQQSELALIRISDNYQNELQFIFCKELHKIHSQCSFLVQEVDKSRINSRDEVHENLIRQYIELKKAQSILDNVLHSIVWLNNDHSNHGVDY
jgi:hypothetical protein